MTWIAIIIAAGLLFYFFVKRKIGGRDFWKVVRDNPIRAAHFFENELCWHVGEKPRRLSVVGPFMFNHPILGRTLKLYCDTSQIDESQKRFINGIVKSPAEQNRFEYPSEWQKAEILLGLVQQSIQNMEAFSASGGLSESDQAIVREHLQSRRSSVRLLAKLARGETLDGLEQLSNFMIRDYEPTYKALFYETSSEFGGNAERLVTYLKQMKSKQKAV